MTSNSLLKLSRTCRTIAALVVFAIPLCSATAADTNNNTLWNLERLGRTPKSEHADDFGASDVHAVLYEGEPWNGKPTKIFAYYGLPARAGRDAPVPGVVCVHGGSGTAFAEWVKIWNRHGFAAIAMDTNGAVPRSLNENPDNFRHEWAGPPRYGFGDAKADVHDQWPYHAVADVILANSLLRSFPEVDKNNVGLTGISWGGYLTSLTAGVDPRFKFAIPVYGCGFLDDGSTWQKMIDDYGHDRWMQLWDPSSYLANTKMATLWINGTNDKHYHLGPFQRTYRLTKGPRSLAIRVRMDHGHGSGWAPPEIYAFARAAVGRGAPLVAFNEQGADSGKAWAQFTAPKDVHTKSAELVYTTDSGDWVDREWKTVPATVDASKHRISCDLPMGTTVYYFNLHDDRDLLVSSEHVVVGRE